MRKDAIFRFDKLVSAPELDLPHLTALIKVHSQGLKAGTQQRQHGERLGDRLNSWLHVTDRASREAFLLNKSTRQAALDLFYKEGNESVMWTWLRLVYERRLIQADITSAQWLDVEDFLVSNIMRLSIQRQDLADAAQQYLEACRYRFNSGRWDTSKTYQSMLHSSSRLASAILFHRHQHGIDSTLFKNILQYLPSRIARQTLNFDFCSIYSPENPTARGIWETIKDPNSAQRLTQNLAAQYPHTRKVVMTSLLDAAKVALDEGKGRQASGILDFAIDHFPEYLPAREKEQIGPEIERYLDFVPA